MTNGIWINQHEYIEFAEEADAMKPALEELATLDKNPAMQISGSLLPNPDPVLIKEGLRIEVFESLENDAQVGSCIETRKLAVTGMEEGIEQGESPDEIFTFIERLYADTLNTEDINDAMLDFRFNGYRVMESNWSITPENRIAPYEILPRDYEFFKFSPAGRLMFVTKTTPDGVDAFATHPNKFMLLRNRPSPKNPYGKALLSSVFWNVAFKRGGMKWWSLLMEKYGIPKVLIKHAPKMDKAKVRELVADAARVILDGVVAVPLGSEVELVESNITGGSSAHDQFIQRQDDYISKRILGHSAAADATAGKLGNDPNAETALEKRTASDARYITAKHNEIIRTIVTLNWGAEAVAPTYRLYKEENTDLVALAEMHNKIYALGYDISPARLQKDFGYDDGDLIKRGDALPQGDTTNTNKPPTSTPTDPPAEFAAVEQIDLTEELLDKSELSADAMLRGIIELVDSSKNYEELQSSLLTLATTNNNAQLVEKLSAHLFFANAAGRIEAEERAE